MWSMGNFSLLFTFVLGLFCCCCVNRNLLVAQLKWVERASQVSVDKDSPMSMSHCLSFCLSVCIVNLSLCLSILLPLPPLV